MKKISLSKNSTGFTLIELILYISLVVILLSALVPFTWNSVETGVKSAVAQEVNSNARYISERIKYEIRNATEINSVSANSISLATSTSSTNPTVIDLSGGNIRIKQGAGSPVDLNSSNTVITSLTFTNLTSSNNATKNIQFIINIAASFAAARSEYQNSLLVEGDAELRSNASSISPTGSPTATPTPTGVPTATPTPTSAPTATPTPGTCSNYCIANGFSAGICRQNVTQCNNHGESHQAGGDAFCTGGANADTCCCQP